MIRRTPLEAWIRDKIRIGQDPGRRDLAEAIKTYQLQRINEVIAYARQNSPFYRNHLASLSAAHLSDLSGIAGLPFTTPSDLANAPFSFPAVRQDDIIRIVTLRTSGSTGDPKRIFFTQEDLELTVDFFHHGMSTLVRPGQRVAILLPGERQDSVGDLLMRGLQRMDVQGLVYGPVSDPIHAAEAISYFSADCLVGIPTQVLAVACSAIGAAIGKGRIKTVLLSTDYVPGAIAEVIKDVWGCRVFNHYGLTETGLGGGVECEALDGYHLREADLYFEIVDHETGEPCPDGAAGEVVFTTLTRKGMPLIRYRTGDIARMIPQPCPCGSVLRRMGRVMGRWDGNVSLGPGCFLNISDMDEALFPLPGLLDYRAAISEGLKGRPRLTIDVHRQGDDSPAENDILQALNRIPAIQKAIAGNNLEHPIVRFSTEGNWTTTGVSKRKIIITMPPLP
jgi:phenylacetate-CoA ligase